MHLSPSQAILRGPNPTHAMTRSAARAAAAARLAAHAADPAHSPYARPQVRAAADEDAWQVRAAASGKADEAAWLAGLL